MKLQLILLASFFTIFLNGQIPTNGLVGSWPFNGNANDESTNTNNGIVSGATLTTDRFGNANSAYSFDGLDDFINLGSHPDLYRHNTDFTISAWIRRTNMPQGWTQPIFTNRTTNSGSEFFVDGQLSGNGGTLGYATYNGSVYGIANSNALVSFTNQYDHVLMVYSYLGSNNNTVKLYINNVLDQTITGLIDIQLSMQDTYIGWSPYFSNVNRHFEGDIDDIFVYDRALSEEERDNLFNDRPLSNVESNTFDVRVYPNPTADNLTIDLGEIKSTLSVSILNALGQVISNHHYETASIFELEVDVPCGVYFIKLDADGQGAETIRIVKNE